MTDFNPYEVLKLDKTATEKIIKKAYRELAKKHHPDKHSNDSQEKQKLHELLFKQINRAYECLSDPEKKARYDEYGVCEEHEMREGKEDSGSMLVLLNTERKEMRGNGKQSALKPKRRDLVLYIEKS